MNIENNIEIKNSGFIGFKRILDLKLDDSSLPKIKGVYLVLRPNNNKVKFVKKGTGGFFKNRNPNVEISKLTKKWINDAQIVYIGKAGGTKSSATLKSRLKQYLNFGQGKKVGHWGGRYIWQIENIDDYIICWKELPKDEPRIIETVLLDLFKQKFNNLPFANLTN